MDDETESFDWIDTVIGVYRSVVAGGGLTGMQRMAAFDLATNQLLTMADSGELKIPTEHAVRAALAEADRREVKQSDAVLKRALAGQDTLDFPGDPILDVVVALGSGLRKQWRQITYRDLAEMDNLRYRNVHNVNTAYAEWRTVYQAAFEVLKNHPTFGDAWDAGAFTPEDASA